MSKEGLEQYMQLNYSIKITPDTELGYFAEIPDLPGCVGDGRTVEEAIADVRDSQKHWLEIALDSGSEIPLPRTDEQFSGHYALRMSRSLHRAIYEEAEEEGVSMNLYLNTLITENRHIRSMKRLKTQFTETKLVYQVEYEALLDALLGGTEATVRVAEPISLREVSNG